MTRPIFPLSRSCDSVFVIKDKNNVQLPRENSDSNWPPDDCEYVTNPYYDKEIIPYVPNDEEWVLEFKEACKNEVHPLFVEDISNKILSQLDVKTLAAFSRVNKFSYVISLNPHIWEVKFNESFPNLTIIPYGLCCFSSDKQFKILHHRVSAELKPFITQYNKNNEILVRLRGSNGIDGELNQLWQNFQALGGYGSVDFFHWHKDYSSITEEEKDKLDKGRKAKKYLELFVHQTDLRKALGGSDYDGTPDSLSQNSNQGIIFSMVNFEIPTIFNNQKKFEGVIRVSVVKKNIVLQSVVAKHWLDGHSLLLVDFGIITPQEYSEKLGCTPNVPKKVGIHSIADIKALGVHIDRPMEEFKIAEEDLSQDVNKKHQQIFERKEACFNFLEKMSEKIQQKIKESESHGTVLFQDNNNVWVEFQKRFEESRSLILGKCESSVESSQNFSQIAKEINGLVEMFNQQERDYQIIKLRAYIHQVDISAAWKGLENQGIQTLSKFVANNPGKNLFRMGVDS